MVKNIKKLALIFLFTVFIISSKNEIQAQSASSTQSIQAKQAELQQQLQDIENQITQYQQELLTIQGEKNTLQNKINQLKKQEATLNLRIRATTLQINDLAGKINDTQIAIEDNHFKIAQIKKQIGISLQIIHERNSANYFVNIIFSDNSLTNIFSQIENYSTISKNLAILLDQTKQISQQLDLQEKDLSQQKDDFKNFLSIQNLQQEDLIDSVDQQKTLLQKTKGKESNYQTALNDKQKQAQEIKNRLYQLLEVPNQITFGEALQIAQWASSHSGVRPAFLLAILTQESSLGKNVGTCNRQGDPPDKSWRVIMNPNRDQTPFLQVTKDLGLNPDTTPISCPMRDKHGNKIGWGGAMGPAQFIPSTWINYQNQVSSITGKTSNPWDIRDAFMAAAIKLAAAGATSQNNEWKAAMVYFSGSTNGRYRFYGDSVVAQATKYQNDIDQLNK